MQVRWVDMELLEKLVLKNILLHSDCCSGKISRSVVFSGKYNIWE